MKKRTNNPGTRHVDDVPMPHPVGNPLCTLALYHYLVEYKKIIGLFMFIANISHRVDATSAYISYVLENVGTDKKLKSLDDISDALEFGKTGATKYVREHRYLLSRFLVCNSVDNFLCYLCEVVSMAIRKKPQLLYSSDQIKV